MTTLLLRAVPRSPLKHLPGMLLAAAIAAAACLLGTLPAVSAWGLGALTLAIVLGIVIGNTLYPRYATTCDDGVVFAKQKLLRLGIILYGFRLTVQQIADVGLSGVLIDVLTLCSTFFLACWLGKHLFGLDRQTRWLIGAGSSICGAAAILATEPVIKADASKVAVAIATVVIFGTLAIFIYPVLWPLAQQAFPSLTETQYGIYAGSTMHEVAQVVAAGHAIGPDAENAAVISKMLRVMMLAPFLLFIGACLRRQSTDANTTAGGVTFPWFALLFIGVALFNSLDVVPAHAVEAINQFDTFLLAMAMAALGLTTHMSALKRAGAKPLLMASLLFVWLIIGGGGINLLIHQLMG